VLRLEEVENGLVLLVLELAGVVLDFDADYERGLFVPLKILYGRETEAAVDRLLIEKRSAVVVDFDGVRWGSDAAFELV
jgi:hypothetical protein